MRGIKRGGRIDSRQGNAGRGQLKRAETQFRGMIDRGGDGLEQLHQLGAREVPPGAEPVRKGGSAAPFNDDEISAIPTLNGEDVQKVRVRLGFDAFQAFQE